MSPKLVKTELGMWSNSEKAIEIADTWLLSIVRPWNIEVTAFIFDVSLSAEIIFENWQNENPLLRSTTIWHSIGFSSHCDVKGDVKINVSAKTTSLKWRNLQRSWLFPYCYSLHRLSMSFLFKYLTSTEIDSTKLWMPNATGKKVFCLMSTE